MINLVITIGTVILSNEIYTPPLGLARFCYLTHIIFIKYEEQSSINLESSSLIYIFILNKEENIIDIGYMSLSSAIAVYLIRIICF